MLSTRLREVFRRVDVQEESTVRIEARHFIRAELAHGHLRERFTNTEIAAVDAILQMSGHPASV